ncbi:transcription factor WhiB [Streptomyces sp. NBC_01373]|uniref:transcription factor WhiB n=1 Tax=Streptomyces sp. NBC_01373 TaxID=2903843 RepID=UPI00225B5207|nr:transcription factor WhiB [Streptomyces sp. NBC_01373]MCX4703915.1 transcription factor WhiB [Streptomyces sp. NBC_01373]
MSGVWFGGLQVRGLDRDQTPVADLFCISCRHHKRVTGRARVTEWLRANPIADHRAVCKAKT